MKVLMTLVLVLLLTGCVAGQGGAGRTLAEETSANGTEETTVKKRAGGLDRPPDSTLSYGRQQVRGSLGSYCWGNVCADAVFFVPPREKTLTVPSGSEMAFRYGGQSPPDTVKARALPLNKQGASTASANPSRSLKAQGSGVERTIPVELPPREYVVDVYVEKSQPFGQTDYFFRVMVE